MAIILARPKGKNLYEIILGVVFIVLILIFFFLVFKRNITLVSVKPESAVRPPQINFSNLENPLLKQLEEYPKPEEFTGVLGRETPFLPSPTTSPTLPTTTLPF